MSIGKKNLFWLALYFLAVLFIMAVIQVLALRLFKNVEAGTPLLTLCRVMFLMVWCIVTYSLLTFRYKWLQNLKKKILEK